MRRHKNLRDSVVIIFRSIYDYSHSNHYYQILVICSLLALFTIFYNLLEGMISIFFGISDEALTLFGFGVDSFIEVMSGIGIRNLHSFLGNSWE